MLKRFAVLMIVCAISGCSDPKPVDIDIDEAAADAGLAPDEYKVNDDGSVNVSSKVDTAITPDDVIAAFKSAGLPIGEVLIQTADTDPNNKLGRPGEYIGSAQFEDSRVKQLEPMPEIETDEPDLPLGGIIEVFDNDKDLQSRKQYIEQVYEMMPAAKQYMYVNNLALLRLEYELTPDQAKEYEEVFMSL
ncbi:hypothetical protein [Psychrobacter sp. JB193]|uniref:hypothetical protein n=1 Tax=Psychrobacter sp. JB193 TaxID=2024406 RepID=UPI00117AC8C6|nr:hypothetical protein [Psychrobacter sp. JB193]